MNKQITHPKALLFDVFGTVVDWRRSIVSDLDQWFKDRDIERDWEEFAQDWRALYQPSMETIRSGARGYVKLDKLHRENLDELIDKYNLTELDEQQRDYVNRVWHRLQPWPDVVEGLNHLKEHHILATLSNANIALMVNLSRYAGLNWDVILGSEPTQSYKPDTATYLKSIELLDLEPHECMMVAAHNYDLAQAKSLGLQTAFIARPTEYGDRQSQDFAANDKWTYIVETMTQLAVELNASLSKE